MKITLINWYLNLLSKPTCIEPTTRKEMNNMDEKYSLHINVTWLCVCIRHMLCVDRTHSAVSPCMAPKGHVSERTTADTVCWAHDTKPISVREQDINKWKICPYCTVCPTGINKTSSVPPQLIFTAGRPLYVLAIVRSTGHMLYTGHCGTASEFGFTLLAFNLI